MGEVAAWIDLRSAVVDADDHRQVVCNGLMPDREIVTGIGPVRVKQPRVHDRCAADAGRESFTSEILPPYLRKSRSIEEPILWLYPRGISTGGSSDTLAALVSTSTLGFSASTVARIKETWKPERKR